jgi:hypothetical protein
MARIYCGDTLAGFTGPPSGLRRIEAVLRR